MADVSTFMSCYTNGVMFGFVLALIVSGISWGFWAVVSLIRRIISVN